MSEISYELSKEAQAARSLVETIRTVVAEDEAAIHDAIEGETNLLEAASRAVSRIAEIDALTEAIKAQRDNLVARMKRLENQGELIRASLSQALAIASLTRMELPQATVALKKVAPKAVVTDESNIPTQFWKRADPTLDKRALLAALKEGPVSGAELSNGGETINITMR